VIIHHQMYFHVCRNGGIDLGQELQKLLKFDYPNKMRFQVPIRESPMPISASSSHTRTPRARRSPARRRAKGLSAELWLRKMLGTLSNGITKAAQPQQRQ